MRNSPGRASNLIQAQLLGPAPANILRVAGRYRWADYISCPQTGDEASADSVQIALPASAEADPETPLTLLLGGVQDEWEGGSSRSMTADHPAARWNIR